LLFADGCTSGNWRRERKRKQFTNPDFAILVQKWRKSFLSVWYNRCRELMIPMDFFQKIAEEKIQEAMRRGEFDNLPGAGKPLPPDDLDRVPEELRTGYKILKNAGLIPEEMQLRKDMISLADLIAVCKDDTERSRLQKELTAKKLRYQMLMAERGWQTSSAFLEYESQIQRKLTDRDG